MDVEPMLVEELSARTSFPWYADVPAKRPARFGTVERTGGAWEECRDAAMVALQCWGPNRSEARAMASEADDAMAEVADLDGVCDVSRTSLANYPSADGVARYQAVYEVTVYD